MVKIGKDLWGAALIALVLLGCAFFLEMRHTKTAENAQKHEDRRTWQAVDSVRGDIRRVKADTDTLKLMLRNFVWVIGMLTIGGIYI